MGFGNGVVDEIFFVPGYNIHGSVVAQVKSLLEIGLSLKLLLLYLENCPSI